MVSSSVIRISNELFAKFEFQLRFPEIEYVVDFLNWYDFAENVAIAQFTFTGRTGMP